MLQTSSVCKSCFSVGLGYEYNVERLQRHANLTLRLSVQHKTPPDMPRNLFTSMATPPPLFRTQTELPPRPVANACSAAMITALAAAAAAFDVAAKKPMPAKVQIADRECCSI